MTSSYKIEFVKSAAKEFRKLSKQRKQSIAEAIAFLAINPFSDNLDIKKIRGAHRLYRLRIRDYRIVYEIEKKKLIVTVIKIGDRKDIYKNR